MDGVIKTLDGMETVLTTLVTWAMNIPKTLLWIIFYPDEVPGYVRKLLPLQAGEQDDKRGDKQPHAPYAAYLRPVVLLLTVALIPALFYRFTPETGVIISRPAETTSVPDESTADLKGISVSGDTYKATARFGISDEFVIYQFKWKVTDYTNPEVEEIHIENSETGKDIKRVPDEKNTAEDTFSYVFPHDGIYSITATASALDRNNPDMALVSYDTKIDLNVTTSNNDKQVTLLKRSLLGSIGIGAKSREKQTLTVQSFSDSLNAQTTAFLALVLLIPPFLFAFVSMSATGKKIDENSIKRTFYEECYYFSPLSLAIWTFYYSNKFFSSDVTWGQLGNSPIYIPLLAALVWFLSVKSKALADVSEDDSITPLKAFLIVGACLLGLSASAAFIYFLQDVSVQDSLRVFLIRIYVFTGLLLLGTYFWNRRKSRMQSQPAAVSGEDAPRRRLTVRKLLLPVSIAIVTLCCVLPAIIFSLPVDESAVSSAPTDTAVVTSSSDTQINTVEALNDKSKDWGPVFMTNGNVGQVKLSYENGGLRLQLSEEQDQIPQAYYINNSTVYGDVTVDAMVKNNGNPDNGVGLICRYDKGTGWYEFEISNAGTYTIYAFDAKQYTYDVLATGQTELILPGISENKYTAVCKGSEMSLQINDEHVAAIEDTKFGFTQGNIGLSLYSPKGLTVDVNFQSIKVTGQPSEQQASAENVDAPIFSTPVPVAEEIPNATPQPEATTTTPIEVPESASFFTDEFDSTLNRWETLGDASQLTLPPENGSLHFQLVQKSGETSPVYLINTAADYTDVQVTVMTTNNGNNSNGVDLICRGNEKGWYEFEISNSGSYAIYALDLTTGNYTLLTAGDSPTIKTGLSQNLYSAVCKGTQLTLLVNENEVASIEETAFNFEEGKVGFGVSSRKGFPVDLFIESVTVSAP